MGLQTKKLLEAIRAEDRHLQLALWWIEVKYAFLDWFYKKTAKLRMKYTKTLILKSLAYYDYNYQMTWDDVDVYDQWGMCFSLGFGIVSKKNWEFDNQINRDIGQPEEPWRDVVRCECTDHKNCGWTSYYFKEDFLNSNHYFQAARKHLVTELGDLAKNKELELQLRIVSQQHINTDLLQQAEWVKGGKKPLKVELTDQAKEDFKKLLGDEDAQSLFDEIQEKNKEIDKQDDTNTSD